MEDLLNHPIKWKYYINLCGTDFPLKTNAEIVRYLSYISPHNEIECVPMSPGKVARLTWHYQLEKGENGKYNVVNTREENPPPPRKLSKILGIVELIIFLRRNRKIRRLSVQHSLPRLRRLHDEQLNCVRDSPVEPGYAHARRVPLGSAQQISRSTGLSSAQSAIRQE